MIDDVTEIEHGRGLVEDCAGVTQEDAAPIGR
jgi:hypothetical protein